MHLEQFMVIESKQKELEKKAKNSWKWSQREKAESFIKIALPTKSRRQIGQSTTTAHPVLSPCSCS